MPEPKRVARAAALDDISDHLGSVLKRADELLAEWSAFGATVRAQVEREAATVGDAVAGAVDGAVARATAVGIDRAIADHVSARLNGLTAELSRLEARARGAARSLSEERAGDRRVLWIIGAGVLVANALLLALLLRKTPVALPVAEPARIDDVAPPAAPAREPSGSAATEPGAGSGAMVPDAVTPAPAPAKGGGPAAPAPAPAKSGGPAVPAPAKAGAVTDPKAGATPPAKSGSTEAARPGQVRPGAMDAQPAANISNAAAPSVRVPGADSNAAAPPVRVPAAKLPPRRH